MAGIMESVRFAMALKVGVHAQEGQVPIERRPTWFNHSYLKHTQHAPLRPVRSSLKERWEIGVARET